MREVILWTDRALTAWTPSAARLSVSARVATAIDWPRWKQGDEPLPFDESLHPVGWRGDRRFGSGAIGDFGARLFALPVVAFGFERLDSAHVLRREDDASHRFSTSIEIAGELTAGDATVPCRWMHGRFAPDERLFAQTRRAGDGLLLRFAKSDVFVPEWNATNAFEIIGGHSRRILTRTFYDSDILEAWIAGCRNRARVATDFISFGVPLTNVLLPLIRARQGHWLLVWPLTHSGLPFKHWLELANRDMCLVAVCSRAADMAVSHKAWNSSLDDA